MLNQLAQIKLSLITTLKKPFVGVTLIVLCMTGAALGISWHQSSDNQVKKQSLLVQLERERQEKLKTNDSQTPSDAGHSDVSDVQFKDISDSKFEKPTCKRLENRQGIIITSSGCDYRLRAHGEFTMAVIFVYEGQSSPGQLNSSDQNNKGGLLYTNTYLKQQAERFKISDPPSFEMTFYGPYKVASVLGTYYRDHGYELLEIFNNTSKVNKVPEENYDIVNFVLIDNIYGGMAFPGLHRSFTYNHSLVLPTFVHETLHLFGASDKYNNNDCNTIGTNDPFGRYNGSLPGHDIMCSNFSLDSSKINDITAREIGWAN